MSMFAVWCERHGARVLLSSSSILSLGNGAQGPAVRWRCTCGPEVVEPLLPILELGAGGAVERDVVEPRPVLLEGFAAVELRELVDTDDRAVAEHPDHVVESSRVLVHHRIRTDELLIPGPADVE